MHIDIQNLGTIESGSFYTNDLTIIFGKNNSGKTYISYATYILVKKVKGLILSLTSIAKDLEEYKESNTYKPYSLDINNVIKLLSSKEFKEKTQELLSSGFCVSSDFFKETTISINTEMLKEKAFSKKIERSINHGLRAYAAFISKDKNSNNLNIMITEEDFKSDLYKRDLSFLKIMTEHFYYEIARYIVNEIIEFNLTNLFIITSERTGIELFYSELDNNRSNLAEGIVEEKIRGRNPGIAITENDLELMVLFEKNVSKYSLPIADNIRSIRNGTRERRDGYLTQHDNFPLINGTIKKITQGNFDRSNLGDTLFIIDDCQQEIPLRMASSSIKSMSLFDIYINKLSENEGTLIIDEPELNLHPDNQILMAELIIRLVNSGIKIIMTTHSDYIIREINNRIKLNSILNKEKGDVLKYVENEIDVISDKRVSAFCINSERKIKEIKINKSGFESVIFDDVIRESSERENKIDMITGN